jgi:hypothetical protein
LEFSEKIKCYVEASKIPIDSISELDVQGNLKEFSSKIELISTAKNFFEENPEFEGSKQAFKNLV